MAAEREATPDLADSDEEQEAEEALTPPRVEEAADVEVVEGDTASETVGQETTPPSPRLAPVSLPSSADIRESLQDDVAPMPPASPRPSAGTPSDRRRPGQEQNADPPVDELSNKLKLSSSSGSVAQGGFRAPGDPASATPQRARLIPAINLRTETARAGEVDRVGELGIPLPRASREGTTMPDDFGSPLQRTSRTDTPLSESENVDTNDTSPPSTPKPRPLDEDDEDDENEDPDQMYSVPNLVPVNEPSERPEARLMRRLMPQLRPFNPKHGITTYSLIPDDRQTEIDGVARPLWGILGNMGDRLAEGSTNGNYLLERRELIQHWQRMQRQGFQEYEFFQYAVYVLKQIEADKRGTIDRMLDMTDTWGGPVRDKKGKIVERVARDAINRHPSDVGSLTPRYKGMSPPKRGPSGSSQREGLYKKVLKKEHKKFTSPQTSEDDHGEARYQVDGPATPCPPKKKRLVIHGPRKPKTDEDVEMADDLGLSAAEIKEQKRMYLDIQGQKRAFADVKRGRSSLPKPQGRRLSTGQNTNYHIIGWELAEAGRTLMYNVLYDNAAKSHWFKALNMQGEVWTEKMEEFWFDGDTAILERLRFEQAWAADPPGQMTMRDLERARREGAPEPSSFGKYIMQARLVDHRDIVFEIYNAGEPLGEGIDPWEFAQTLPNDWDDAINDYWKTYEVKKDWYKRMRQVEKLKLVRPNGRCS
ncbi:uncharacterized protein LTR77_000096 [Saxophila tyrrhenica]|uniref:Uncharacterized protein n=1 Tax=Saxophila tyrrhenica TaxID=1690608 RepID=A0AAV9PN38_9PEZI|nr:hypothetical protein LTR77_000096 [Saxophila tyrrhenica]